MPTRPDHWAWLYGAVELVPVQGIGVANAYLWDPWSGGLGNGSVAGGAGGAEWVGLRLECCPGGSDQSCGTGSGGGGGGGNSCFVCFGGG